MNTDDKERVASSNQKRLKLGIIANEFFDGSVGRFGGFGWAARQVARFFADRPELGVDVVYLARQEIPEASNEILEVHGTPLIPVMPSRLKYWRAVYKEKFDLLLCIDWRANYYPLLRAMPRTPVIVWARDPRTSEDSSKLRTIRVPGGEHYVSRNVLSATGLSMQKAMRLSRRVIKRPILFATPSRYLAHKIEDTYSVRPDNVTVMPNIIDMEPGTITKSEKPSVIFLGRLDPVKRPWLFSELARQFPEVDFIFCGKAHETGADGWDAGELPPNVQLRGHVDGEEKTQLLKSAWVLINTSIHEGLAVSFQEALRCETPVLASVDPQGVVSAFGIYAGYWEGTGLDGLPRFAAGLKTLLEDDELRTRLGREGREWVQKTHTAEEFYAAFESLCIQAGVRPAVSE